MQLAQPRNASVSVVSNNRTEQTDIKLPCKSNDINQMAKAGSHLIPWTLNSANRPQIYLRLAGLAIVKTAHAPF